MKSVLENTRKSNDIPYAKNRHQLVAAVYLLLEQDGKYLFLKRQNTGFMDGLFGLPSGHVEYGEPIIQGMIREAKEEIDITIKQSDLTFLSVTDRNAEDFHRIDFLFSCNTYTGEIKNAEPHKCSKLAWLTPNEKNIIPYMTKMIQKSTSKNPYATDWWDQSTRHENHH